MKKFLLDELLGICTFGGQEKLNKLITLKKRGKVVAYTSPNCIIKQADSIKGLFDTIIIEGYVKAKRKKVSIFGAYIKHGYVFFFAPRTESVQIIEHLTFDFIFENNLEVYGMAWDKDRRYLTKIAKMTRNGGFVAL